MTVSNKLETILQEVAVAKFDVLARKMHKKTEQNNEEPQ
jgi:hypothetical protein